MVSQPNILAIVGRPNVGKSALFNRVVGRRVSIVHEQAGVTRDRVSAQARWQDKQFEVIDTGGIAFLDDEKDHADVLAVATRQQAEVAIAMATVLVLVVDVSAGILPLDREIARKLRTSGKPILLAINKVDNDRRGLGIDEFSELGFAQSFPIAAIHGLGVPELLAAATADFVSVDTPPAAQPPTKLAIVGRPNVGKSSLVNAILQSERTIVSDIAGTTRDSVDVPFRFNDKPYLLIDTAGLRHKRKIKSSVDQFGLMRAERTIRDCDLAVLVLDARDGVTKQDKAIAGQVEEAGRGCVIVVNKWDLAAAEDNKAPKTVGRSKPKSFRQEYVEALRKELFFLSWAPVLFVSAKTGQCVTDVFGQVSVIERELAKRVETPQLNKALMQAMDAYPPSIVHGRRLRVYYAFQQPVTPPSFTLFVNDKNCLTPHYERYLVARLRDQWGFLGCPVRLQLRPRERRAFVKS